jgi:hypothetical protein
MPTLPTFATRPKRPSRPAAKPPRLNPWYGHLITVAVLLLVYAAGYSGGRDAAPLSRAANHPACHPNLKP